MKHPALVRVLAVALAVVSVLTLLSGAMCMGKAAKDNNENTRRYEVLSDKTKNASLLQRRLEEDRAGFDCADRDLTDTRKQYGESLAEYRKELSTHTATKAGLVMGRDALGTASSAMNSGWAQYEQGLAAYEQGAAAFDAGYQQYLTAKQGLEQGWAAYYEGVKQLEANAEELEQQRQQVEEMMSVVTATKEKIAALKEYIAGLKDQLPEDQAALEEKLKELEERINQLAPKLSQYEKEMLVYNAACALYEEAEKLMDRLVEQGYSEEEVKAKADELCMQGFGMSFEELKLWLAGNKPVLDKENQEIQDWQLQIALTQEQYEALLALIQQNKDLLDRAEEALAKAEAELTEQERQLQAALEAMEAPAQQLALLKEQLEEGQKQLEASEPAILEGKAQMESAKAGLDTAKTALEQAQRQLAAGWGEIAQKEKELEEQAKELKEEKQRLEGVHENINTMELAVEDFEGLEEEDAAAKAALMAYDGIAGRVNGGGELIASARSELQAMETQAQGEYRGRLVMSALMVLCGVFGLIAVLAAFEKIGSGRLWLYVSAAALLAAGSEACSSLLSRGLLYTAVFVMIFGIALLPLSLRKR